MKKRRNLLVVLPALFTIALAGCDGFNGGDTGGGGGEQQGEGVVTEHAAVAPTCTTDGNVKYYTNSDDPGVYYSDEECTQTIESIIVSKTGHDVTEHPAVANSCTTDGNIKYYTCSHEPGVYYSDEACTQTIESVVVPQTGHSFKDTWSSNATHHWHDCSHEGCTEKANEGVHQEASEWTITDTGHSKKCTVCNEVAVAEVAHTFTAETVDTKYLKSDAGCSSAAVYYKSCSVCGKSSEGLTGEATFTSGSVDANKHGTLVKHEETIPTHEAAGNLEYYSCPDCEATFADSLGLVPITQQSTVIDTPVFNLTKNTQLGVMDKAVDKATHNVKKESETSTGNAQWFNINDEMAKGAVYVEAKVKLTLNFAYADIGIIMARPGDVKQNNVLRAGLYVPAADAKTSQARIRSIEKNTDGTFKADTLEQGNNLPATIDLSEGFVKVGFYRKGSIVNLFVNDKLAVGLNSFKQWADAADETVRYEYGVFGQNVGKMYFEDCLFEYGDVAISKNETLTNGGLTAKERYGGLNNFQCVTASSAYLTGSWCSSFEAPFKTTTEQKKLNTYVETNVALKDNAAGKDANDKWSTFGFMLTKGDSTTNEKNNIIAKMGLYINNANQTAVNGYKFKQYLNSSEQQDCSAAGIINNVVDFANGAVKLAIYRSGTTLQAFMNDQLIMKVTKDDWNKKCSLMGDDSNLIGLNYELFAENTSVAQFSDAKILVGEAADAAVAGKTSTWGPYNANRKMGNYGDPGTTLVSSSSTININEAKTGVFNRMTVAGAAIIEATINLTAAKEWSSVGLMIVDPTRSDANSQEIFSLWLKHNSNANTQGYINKIGTKCCGKEDSTALSTDTINQGTDLNVVLYRDATKIVCFVNGTEYEIAESRYSAWTDFSDATKVYNYGVFSDGSAITKGTIKNVSMKIGNEAVSRLAALQA